MQADPYISIRTLPLLSAEGWDADPRGAECLRGELPPSCGFAPSYGLALRVGFDFAHTVLPWIHPKFVGEFRTVCVKAAQAKITSRAGVETDPQGAES